MTTATIGFSEELSKELCALAQGFRPNDYTGAKTYYPKTFILKEVFAACVRDNDVDHVLSILNEEFAARVADLPKFIRKVANVRADVLLRSDYNWDDGAREAEAVNVLRDKITEVSALKHS